MKLPYSHELFVDREEELKVILDIVASLLAAKRLDAKERVIHVAGQTNIGKSWLLRECNYRLDKDTRNLSLYVGLEHFAMRSTAQEFMKGVLDYVDNKVSNTLNVNSPYTRDSNGSILTDENLIRRSYWVTSIIEQVQREKVVVLLFDEIHLLSGERAELLESLEDYLLAGILNMPNSVCVLAGRFPVAGWKDFNLRPQRLTFHEKQSNTMNLSGFDLEKTREQLQNRKSNAKHLAEKILELGNGSPGNNDTLLQQASGNPLEIKDDLIAIRACNQELVEIIKNLNLTKELAWDWWSALEALCVVQDFDEDEEVPVLFEAHTKLQGKLGRGQADRLFDALLDLNIGPARLINRDLTTGAYVIDELMSGNIERELMLRDLQLWQALQCAAMNMYQKWADEYDSDIFEEKAKYHRERLSHAGFQAADCKSENVEASNGN